MNKEIKVIFCKFMETILITFNFVLREIKKTLNKIAF
jgi:hypothetical protein